MSTPSSRIWPSVGRSNPAIMRRLVVLPQPEGPSSEKNSPGRHLQIDPGDRREVAETLHQIDELYLSSGHRPRSIARSPAPRVKLGADDGPVG